MSSPCHAMSWPCHAWSRANATSWPSRATCSPNGSAMSSPSRALSHANATLTPCHATYPNASATSWPCHASSSPNGSAMSLPCLATCSRSVSATSSPFYSFPSLLLLAARSLLPPVGLIGDTRANGGETMPRNRAGRRDTTPSRQVLQVGLHTRRLCDHSLGLSCRFEKLTDRSVTTVQAEAKVQADGRTRVMRTRIGLTLATAAGAALTVAQPAFAASNGSASAPAGGAAIGQVIGATLAAMVVTG